MKMKRNSGFTLVEVLVSITILTMIMLIVTEVISVAQRSWKFAASRVSQFRETRMAFDSVVKNLRQAALNPYYDFKWDAAIIDNPLLSPGPPSRTADLGIFVGRPAAIFPNGAQGQGQWANSGNGVVFQAPLGYTLLAPMKSLKGLLNARGYAVQYGSDTNFVPQGLRTALTPKLRYRLVEFRPPTELNSLYAAPGAQPWVPGANLGAAGGGGGADSLLVPLADNVIGLSITPGWRQDALTGVTAFGSDGDTALSTFDSYSRASPFPNQLPRVMRVTMVAIDEASASRLSSEGNGRLPDLVTQSGANLGDPSTLGHRRELARLSDYLARERVNYRIFSEVVDIPAADR
jgi:uncharacterized protein (TIGR02599 family)